MNLLPLLFTFAVVAAAPKPSLKSRVEKFLRDSQKELKIPGLAYAVVQGDKVVQSGALGKANLTYGVRATTQTPFLLASVTKQFTAAGIMKLVEEGKVRLDEPISTYLTDAPESWRGITVRNLLQHTAGLKDRFEEKDTSKWRLNYSTQTMYAAAKETPLDFAPGTRWQYSDQGYFLLGKIIEEVSGERYRLFLQEKFFHPLGMDHTTTVRQDEIFPGLAEGYALAGGKWIHNHRRTEYGLVSHFGAVSTVEDLAKWVIALRDGKVLKPETLRQMWTPALIADGSEAGLGSFGYGFGWFLDTFNGHRIVQHGGSTGTSIWMLPDDKLAVIVLTNLEQLSGGDATGISRTISKMYVPEVSWGALKQINDPAAQPVVDEVRGVLTGTPPKAEMYEENYFKLFKPALGAQLAAIKELGVPKSSGVLFDRRAPGLRAVGVSIEYAKVTLYATARLNASGKIANLLVEDEEVP